GEASRRQSGRPTGRCTAMSNAATSVSLRLLYGFAFSMVCSALLLLGACSRTPADPRLAAFAALPDWSGIWRLDAPQVGVDGFPFIDQQPGPATSIDAPLTIFNFGA